MDSPPELSATCPILIGRAAQLAALGRRLDLARGGHGQVALIAGEAGVGKSRLAAELQAHAATQGFAIFRGRCFESDFGLPYAPLLDLLRAHLGPAPPEALPAALGPLAADLAALLPEFAVTGTPGLEPEHQRRRVEQAFVRFFLHHSGAQPLLVIVEDLHWSDDASLQVLLTLARRSSALPIVLLLTYRDGEANASLGQLLATLERERLAGEVRLAPLDEAELDLMLRAIFGQRRPIRGEFLSALYSLTEGNPFFVEEILNSLIAAGDIFFAHSQWDRKPLAQLNIPRTMYVAVRRRVDLLSEEARQLLTLAAVAGRRFGFALLHTLTGHDERRLLELIKALIAAQLVVEESAEVFAFRHALTREALYTELLARERRALHGRVAEALERLAQSSGAAPEAWVAELAEHCYQAGLWPRALEYAQRAAARAQRLYAPRAAAAHLSRALEAARQLDLAAPAAMHRARGQMYDLLGEFEPADDDFHAALSCAQASGDRQEELQALLAIGFLWAARDYSRMGEYLRRGLDLARTLDDPTMLGHSLNRVGNWYLVAEQPHAALRYHHEALGLFEAAGDRPGLAATHDLLGVTHIMGDDIVAGIRHYQQAIALFRELGDLQGLSSSLAMLSMRGASYPWTATAWPIVAQADCVRDGEEALQIARRIDWRAGEAGAQIYLSFGHGPRGQYQLALERAQAASEIAQEIAHAGWMVGAWVAQGAIALDLLALDPARGYLEQALALARQIGSFFTQIAAGLLASAYVAQRDFAGAEDLLNTALDSDLAMQTRGQRLVWCARAELALAVSDPVLALQIVDRLIGSAANAALYGDGCVPRLWRLRGEALAAQGRLVEAEVALLAADAGALARGLPPSRWRIQASLGRLYQSQGRRKQASLAFASARALVDELAAAVPDSGLREGFLRSVAQLIPRPPAATTRRAAKQSYDGLTEREREIAVLIARGQINREIAEALVVGERTVETHISNILSKLGFSSRRQIAEWALAKGLARRVE
jgi:DNA-binding CsgD family transcriptional regulator